MLKQLPLCLRFVLPFCLLWGVSFAQPTWTLDPFGKEKKPEQYENKKLGSEKTAEKKFKLPRRIIQNTVSHYNYFFNANNKINAVIERAKMGQKDDFSRLLSFYPYSLENTASQKTELDSVILKSTAGVLLHDLRTDWVDNFYLLIGKSYFLRKEFDSAAFTFQFINYNLFPRKKKDGDDSKVIGTNAEPGAGLSIADKEKRNIIQKTFTIPPSRNDALIWLVRTFTEQGEFGDAAGMINILQNDRNLPKRLKNDLEEVTAYWFFVQKNYDSSAAHLEYAISNADDKQDKSRWEFLLAQLLEMNGSYDKAKDYYARASKHTTDPVMDIHAQLNRATMMRNNGDYKELEASIANLLKMAKKDKYENYRDIIYYSAGRLSMQKPDTANSIVYYDKATQLGSAEKITYKNRSFLALGDIAYSQHRYRDAARYYDSLQLDDPEMELVATELNEKKQVLGKLVQHYEVYEREDSLQQIAAMPEKEREDFVKKLSRKYRKEKGIKDTDESGGSSPISFANDKNAPADLFASPSKGEWYFNNSGAKSRGFSEFKSKWGKRENVDNWRRKVAMDAGIKQMTASQTNDNPDVPKPGEDTASTGSGQKTDADYSFEGMMANLPLTAAQLDSSRQVAASNLLSIAKIFQNELLDYEQAIIAYTEYLEKYPNTAADAEVYTGLYYCYNKLGDAGKAAYYKNIVTTKFAGTKYSIMITNPSALDPNKKDPEATGRYEGIYNKFIEGRFAEAVQDKKQADSLYGNHYWTPQLLYIGAVHYIKERNDSLAIAELTNLRNLYPASPLSEKAATMIDVLSRRKEIEDYLNKLEVTRAEEEIVIVGDEKAATVQKPAQQPAAAQPPVKKLEVPAIKTVVKDSVVKTLPQFVSGSFVLEPTKPHYVVMVLDKVDPVYVNEAKNALTRYNKGIYALQQININKDALDAQRALLLFAPFENADAAIKYYDRVKKAAPSELSWLQPAKYSFLVISEANLQLLKTNKDIPAYRQLLNANFGNKF